MVNFKLGEDELTLNIVNAFLNGDVKVTVSAARRKNLEKVRKFVEDHIDSEHVYYGINTGFGRLANTRISGEQLEDLQLNLVRSHAFGVGELMDESTARLMMLLRGHVIAMGYSGASPEVLDLLMDMINKGVIPVVPSKGSVGASGDLSPLSHLALAMIGEGEAVYNGKRCPAKKALTMAGLKPVRLRVKDGLTLINGTQAMTSLASIAILRARRLIHLTDISASLSIEGLRGSAQPFDADVHKVRAHKGQVNSAEMMRRLIEKSQIIASHINCSRVQDPYSLRCIPQVHGSVRDAFYYSGGVVSCELNGCTDNPLVFADSGRIVSGGNFHGEPLAMAMDMLSIGMAELGSIAERRIEQLTNPKSGDLSVMFLTPRPGLNSGFMIPHVVASSLVSENKTLAHPASIDSIPTSGGQEDHVSMGMWAAQKALKIIENVEWICMIEMMAACQAIDLHEKKLNPGLGTRVAYDFVRTYTGFVEKDRWLMPEFRRLQEAVMKDQLVSKVEAAVGKWIV